MSSENGSADPDELAGASPMDKGDASDADRNSVTPEEEEWLEAFRELRSVTEASKVIGKSVRTVERWKKRSKAFRERWDAINREHDYQLETSMLTKAIDGWDEPVFYRGQHVANVRKFSAKLMIFLSSTRMRAKYGRDSEADRTHAADQDALELREAIAAMQNSVPPSGAPAPRGTQEPSE